MDNLIGKILNESQIKAIDSWVLKNENFTSQLRVRNWLEQFDFEEWDLAIKALSKVEYYSIDSMMLSFNNGLQNIIRERELFEEKISEKIKAMPEDTLANKKLKKHYQKQRNTGQNDVQILAIGKPGKSGSNMLYYIYHSPDFEKSNFKILNHVKDININNENNFLHLVLVDDFLGSGNSTRLFINNKVFPELSEKGIKKVRIYILCVTYMKDAKKHILKFSEIRNISFFGTKRVAAFSNIHSPFGYRQSMLPVREFCYKYGIKIYTHSSYVSGIKTSTQYPLGYKNSQSLIVFEHTVPNNTLPIFWSTQNNWIPLFPRVISARLNELSKLRNEAKIWISIAANIGFKNIFGGNKYSSENIKLFCCIRLMKKHSQKLTIAQKMGISDFEMNDVILNGINRGILVDEKSLTEYGEKLYSEILKKAGIKKKPVPPLYQEILYIPKTFRGKT